MINKILVPIGDITQYEAAITQAISLARASSARVNLLGMVQSDVSRFADPVVWYKSKIQKLEFFNTLKAQFEAQDVVAKLSLVDTFLPEKFMRYINDHDFDMIVISEKDVITRTLMQSMLAHLSVPVLFARESSSDTIRRILVPLDCSRRAECILPIATVVAQSMNATLLLAHVTQEPDKESDAYLQHVYERLPDTTQIINVAHTSVSGALQEIITQEGVDMVMLSAHGSSGKPDQHMGRVTHELLESSQTSTLVLQDMPSALLSVTELKSGRYAGVV